MRGFVMDARVLPLGRLPRWLVVPHNLMILLLLLAFLLSQYSGSWRVPFFNEDYAFLDQTRGRSFLALLSEPGLLAGPWFRPWSQGIHFWFFQYTLGTHVELWHLVNLILCAVTLALYFSFARRLAGANCAAAACAGSGAMAAWGVLVTWISGVQDLWMLVFAMGFLHAVASERRASAMVALLGAMLSKETALVLPSIAWAWHLVVKRRTPWQAWLRTWPFWLAGAAWAVVCLAVTHRSHSLQGLGEGPSSVIPGLWLVGRAVMAVLNVDALPHPENGWLRASGVALLGMPALAAMLTWSRRAGSSDLGARGASPGGLIVVKSDRGGKRVATFGLAWALLGWTPLLFPSLNWHSYYGAFGSLGAWLAIGGILARFPRIMLLLLLTMAVLRAGRSDTQFRDWGEESYVRRAGVLLGGLKTDLLAKCPSPAPHTRFYFHQVPSGAGFLIGNGPSIRIWYDDPTLEARFWREFRTREPFAPKGEDRFFRFDSLGGWIEVVVGSERLDIARGRNAQWSADHQRLARTLALGEDWDAALREYAKLSEAIPDSASFPFMAGLAALAIGDSVLARRWLTRAAEHPGADEEIRKVAGRPSSQ